MGELLGGEKQKKLMGQPLVPLQAVQDRFNTDRDRPTGSIVSATLLDRSDSYAAIADEIGIPDHASFGYFLRGAFQGRIPGNLNAQELFGRYFAEHYPKVKTPQQFMKVLSDQAILLLEPDAGIIRASGAWGEENGGAGNSGMGRTPDTGGTGAGTDGGS